MTGKPRQQRTRPEAATPPPAGPDDAPAAEPADAGQLGELRAQIDDLRAQMAEHAALLAPRLERRRRRIAHPRLYPQ